jgi:large subunit ribosomal protein L17
LGRVTEHRIALLRNQAIALLRHEKIETTMPKAKELRPFVERLITIAKRGVAAGEANGKSLHARRLVLAELPDKAVVGKLFDTLAPRFAERPGGYTRILRVGFRRGDAAEVAHVELVGSEYNPKADCREGRRRKRRRRRRASASVSSRRRSGCARLAAEGGSKAQAGGQTEGQGSEEHDSEKRRAGRKLPTSNFPGKRNQKQRARQRELAGRFSFGSW